jgi:preprotein translocase subunit SecA
MFNIFTKFNRNSIDSLKTQVQKINSLENEFIFLTQSQIKEKIYRLQKKYQLEKELDSILIETFALTREASKRVLGLRHFDTQLMGGMVLHNGKIAEMKTGEGKTLVATLPVVLNALSLRGVHLVTVNDYLAKRDKQLMGRLYRYLGLSVGLIQENMSSNQRRQNYLADITYVTNSQLAFDYLRDNMVRSIDDVVLRSFNFCIIDEVDSILIDEARTPLIIAGVTEGPLEKYIKADEVCNFLQYNKHYRVDEKNKNIILTSNGIKQAEQILDIVTLYDIDDPWIPYIDNALKAKIFYLKDINYIVEDNQIYIIDEFTGRIMQDRRWANGLHEAIEAKEQVPIKKGSETLNSITYQNFFLLFPKFAGMTGTAKTAESEFEKIYNQQVFVIPTYEKMVRQDLPDLIFKTEFGKWKEIAKQVEELYLIGRPVLIGTTSIEKSIIISELLKISGIKYNLLNAKPENINLESQIIAQAGKKKAVTVATNMAGRGTDILLGGNPDFQTRQNIFLFLSEIRNPKIINLNKILNSAVFQNLDFYLRQFEIQQIFQDTLKSYKNNYLSSKDLFFNLKIISLLNKSIIDEILINLIENGYQNIQNPIYIYFESLYNYFYKKNKKNCDVEKNLIKNLGGLYVIGSERHESRRIDNQLRGRAGRQGDPGTSRFFISLEDNLFRIFGGDNIKNLVEQLKFSEDITLSSTFLTNTLDNGQKKVEEYYYETRKKLFEYDNVINIQRISIYRERRQILNSLNLRSLMIQYGEELIFNYAKSFSSLNEKNKELEFQKLNFEITAFLNSSASFLSYKEVKLLNYKEIGLKLCLIFWEIYDSIEQNLELIGPGFVRFIEKQVILKQIDLFWKLHLQKSDSLKETIGWRTYGQLDPLIEYKNEASNLYLETISEIKYNSVYNFLKIQIQI